MDTGVQAKTRVLAVPLSWPPPGRSLSLSLVALSWARWCAGTADEPVSNFHGSVSASRFGRIRRPDVRFLGTGNVGLDARLCVPVCYDPRLADGRSGLGGVLNTFSYRDDNGCRRHHRLTDRALQFRPEGGIPLLRVDGRNSSRGVFVAV